MKSDFLIDVCRTQIQTKRLKARRARTRIGRDGSLIAGHREKAIENAPAVGLFVERSNSRAIRARQHVNETAGRHGFTVMTSLLSSRKYIVCVRFHFGNGIGFETPVAGVIRVHSPPPLMKITGAFIARVKDKQTTTD